MHVSLVSEDENAVRVHVAGSVTQQDLPTFDEPLGALIGPAAYGRNVLVSLADVEVLDSSGVNWLLRCHRRFRDGQGRLIIHSPSHIVRNVLRVLNLDAFLKLAGNESEALAAIQENASQEKHHESGGG